MSLFEPNEYTKKRHPINSRLSNIPRRDHENIILILLELTHEIRFAIIHNEKIIDNANNILAEKAFRFLKKTKKPMIKETTATGI